MLVLIDIYVYIYQNAISSKKDVKGDLKESIIAQKLYLMISMERNDSHCDKEFIGKKIYFSYCIIMWTYLLHYSHVKVKNIWKTNGVVWLVESHGDKLVSRLLWYLVMWYVHCICVCCTCACVMHGNGINLHYVCCVILCV